ncbi:MAG: type II toxin-antitoxin system mRNA interferase toxin, RelE/StbE family [Candidatus Nomurabacteria bacterium]|nr:type II toxin-antitoxin system mRNA interferase toxin, RelE/StbE family [Candidatus Nomurabacteria bacterium]
MINVVYTKDFYKSLKKKDKFIQEKARERIKLFREDPFNFLLKNHALIGEYENRRSFNVTGDYRILFYNLNENTVVLVDIGTHPELYE